MAGPNLEVLRFGFYVFFPVAMMLKFGDPEWYNSYVVPYGKVLWPDLEKTNKPPHTSSEIHEELARLKTERLNSKRSGGSNASPSSSSSSTTAPSISNPLPISSTTPGMTTATPADPSLASLGGFAEKMRTEEQRSTWRESRVGTERLV